MIKDKLIISIYDLTGNWVEQYIKAGYPVILWDKKVEGCILEGLTRLMLMVEATGLKVHGLFAATPCTDFASSGARWFTGKDKKQPGYEPFDSTTELSVGLALIILHLVDIFKPDFWVMENPVGRLETLVPEIKPYRKFSFDPCDFGDPYTKKTILWGEFNANLTYNNVFPLYGSMMHNITPGPKRQEIRSATPKGFSKAFFQANL
jgi:hypothetical protein